MRRHGRVQQLIVNFIGIALYSVMFPTDRATCFPPPPRLRPNCNAAAGAGPARRAGIVSRPPHPPPPAAICRALWSATRRCTPHRLPRRASRFAASLPHEDSNRDRSTNMAGYVSLKVSSLSLWMRPVNLSRSP